MFNKKKKFKHFSLVPHYAAQLLFSALLLLFKDHYILHMLKASDTKLVLTLYNLLNILLCQYTQIYLILLAAQDNILQLYHYLPFPLLKDWLVSSVTTISNVAVNILIYTFICEHKCKAKGMHI